MLPHIFFPDYLPDAADDCPEGQPGSADPAWNCPALTLGMGIRQSSGLFLEPVTRDLALTAADFPLALAVQNIVWGLSQAPVGAIGDRFGLRVSMIVGAVIYVIRLGVMAAQGAVGLIVSGALIGVALSCTATSLAMTACVRAVSAERRA